MNGLRVIKLDGELEIGRKSEIANALQLNGTGAGVLLDFSDVTYADSTILAELLRFYGDAKAKDLRVAIVIGSRQFARLIQYAGLAEAFPVFDSRAAALTYLSGGIAR